MNFVFLSPHFPPNYTQFAVQLKQLGANVLGLGDEPYELLNPELKANLTQYYWVSNMHNYDELLRGCGYFTHAYGKIDRLDSHNEYWLETEARLRTDFNIEGIKTDTIARIKRKSVMKEIFQEAGVAVARGKIVQTIAEAQALIQEFGYPVIAKPDIGVGAAKTYKIRSPEELESFFAQKPPVDYILEEFIDGVILSFDGLANREGQPVFYTAHQYSDGVMEVVNDDRNVFYYSLRQIPEDLEADGRKVLKAFNVRERFFHFEFFRSRRDGSLVALEVNIRPPGGLTTDMFNYANDIDVYYQWAHVLMYNCCSVETTRPYHCCYAGRKLNRSYAHTHEEILANLGSCLVHNEPMSGVFSPALGDFGYIIRSPDLSEILAMTQYIQEPA